VNKSNRKICVVSSSRADYNHLYPLITALDKSKVLDLQLVVTGMHLMKQYGFTYKEIENDNFNISAKIKTGQHDLTTNSIVSCMANQITNSYRVFSKLKPDILVILGDRYDILPIAIMAQILDIPIAHFHGGEKTIAVLDDNIRHAITKLSHLHFVANKDFKNRVLQLGENKKNIYNIGSLGVLALNKIKYFNKKKIFEILNISTPKKYILISIHPEILEKNNKVMSNNILSVLNEFKEYYLIFTRPNSDKHSRIIHSAIEKYVSTNSSRSLIINSAGRELYLSLVKNAQLLIGNSSSCLIEAPCLSTPSIIVGDRQKGRPIEKSVIKSSRTIKSIRESIKNALTKNVKSSSNRYYRPTKDLSGILDIFYRCDVQKLMTKDFNDLKRNNI
tara:strand:+ start:1745 stop:2914 length:1170 start_codon:yes stop_codon:yes gene_type:complete